MKILGMGGGVCQDLTTLQHFTDCLNIFPPLVAMNCSVGLQSSVGNERCLRRLPISAHVSLFNNITGYVCGLHTLKPAIITWKPPPANACQAKYVTTTGIHRLSYVPLDHFYLRFSRLHPRTNLSFPLHRLIHSFISFRYEHINWINWWWSKFLFNFHRARNYNWLDQSFWWLKIFEYLSKNGKENALYLPLTFSLSADLFFRFRLSPADKFLDKVGQSNSALLLFIRYFINVMFVPWSSSIRSNRSRALNVTFPISPAHFPICRCSWKLSRGTIRRRIVFSPPF